MRIGGSAEWKHVQTGQCMDMMHSDHQVGVWDCGGGANQPNQHFAFDSATGLLVTLDSADPGNGGLCLSSKPKPGEEGARILSRLSTPK